MRDMKNFEVTDQDYAEIAKACLDTVERTDHVATIVLPPGTDPRVRAAMTRLRPVVAPDAVPRSTAFSLPENYFNFAFQYFLEPSGWSSQSYKITVCSENRHWVPKDDAAPTPPP